MKVKSVLCKAVKEFADRHHMECRSASGSTCSFALQKEDLPNLLVEIRMLRQFLLVETCLMFPIKPTLKNLRWVNRLNAHLPNVRLVIDGSLKFREVVEIKDVEFTSNEKLDGLFLGGMFWMLFYMKAIGAFLRGKMSEDESCSAIIGKCRPHDALKKS